MVRIENVVYANISKTILNSIEFKHCSFKEYNFYRAEIINCVFINCDFTDANFNKSVITNCKFINCTMQFCGMVRISIYGCEFNDCDLWHSNLCHSKIHETKFTRCILKALYKELDWINNTYDKSTLVESCGGPSCRISIDLIEELINSSKRTIDNYKEIS